jgi:mRNA interferase MazF
VENENITPENTYLKDFNKWNEQKKEIDFKEKARYCKSREVWWCSVGLNIGFEENGKGEIFRRPVLILKRLSKNTALIAPITKSVQEHKFRIKIGIIDNKKASVIMSQIKTIDTKRLSLKICMLDKNIFDAIKKAFKELL